MSDPVVITGSDVFVLNGRNLSNFADDDVSTVTFGGKLVNAKKGKNNTTIFALNAAGELANVELNILRGSADDKFILGLLNQQRLNPKGTPLLQGQFTKNLGTGGGNILADTSILNSGMFEENPVKKDNVGGDTTQGTVKYKMIFSSAPRSLG